MLIIMISSLALNKSDTQQQAEAFKANAATTSFRSSPLFALFTHRKRRRSQSHLTPGHLRSQCFLSIFELSPQIRGEASCRGSAAKGSWPALFVWQIVHFFSVTSRRCVAVTLSQQVSCFLPLSTCVSFGFPTPPAASSGLKLSAPLLLSLRRFGCSETKMGNKVAAERCVRVRATDSLCTVHIFAEHDVHNVLLVSVRELVQIL